MLTPFQTRKFTRMFEALDVNVDAALDLEDVSFLMKRFAEQSGGKASAAELDALKAAYTEWYSGIIQMADANKDGKVSLAEFLAFQEKMTTDAALYEQIIGAITKLTCKILDRDGDGLNDTEDYVQFCRVLRIGEAGASERWATLSSKRNGRMSVDDMRGVLDDFYRGTDTNSPATNFLGTV